MMNRRTFVLTGGAALAAIPTFARSLTFNQEAAKPTSHVSPLLLGADYYPDQTAEHFWEEDAAQMAAMGITNVRIAEFAWALMQPSEDKFDFAWLDRSVRILHAHDIAVILGTPSAAPPPWLSQKYPEIMMVNDHGATLATGSRRFTCPTNKTYRRLSLQIATHMANTFAKTPGVIGWQIDNEFTLGDSGRCYCRYCREGFQQWLKNRYHSLDAINEAWGTVFWSNTYTDFAQVPVPLPSGAPPNPGLVLDYDRYQSYANVSFQQEQLSMLRKLCPTHFVTTNNLTGIVDVIDGRDLYRDLDFVSSDNYPGFFSVYAGVPPETTQPMISFGHDCSRGAKDGKPFLIMEEQTGEAGQPFFSPQPEPGQLRLWTYQAIAHGAMGINYFRWDTANFGAEEYWHGILRHDRSRSPGYDELKQTITELKTLGTEALHASYVANLALCLDPVSDWALTVQPSQSTLRYSSELITWHGCLSAAYAGVDIVNATEDLSRYKMFFAPVMYVVSSQQAERIRAFVEGGGTFVAGFRLGVKKESSRIVETPLPGLLRDVMGVEVIDYQAIYTAKQSVKFSGLLAGADGDCKIWGDILDPKGSETLAVYTSGAAKGKAAITSHNFGKGKAIYLGAHLEPADLARVLLTLIAASGFVSPIKAHPGIEVTHRKSDHETLTYLLNHTAAEQTVQIAGSGKDALNGSAYSGSVTVDPYGIRVLRPASSIANAR